MRRTTTATGLLVALMLLEGCGAYRANRRGHTAAREADWDRAVAHYTIALKKKPENIGYKIALENARIQASRHHQEEARKLVEADLFDKAEEELKIAANYDPSNRAASDELVIVRRRIELREAEKAQRTDYDEMRRKAAASRYPIATLSPRSVHPIAVKLPETTLDKIFRTLGTLSGVNVLFSQDFKATQKASVELSGVTFEQALEQICKTNKVFYKVLDQNTLIIVPETLANRKLYDELVLRTFYLQHAEAMEIQNLLKTVLGNTVKIVGNKDLRTLTAVGTPDRVAIAERIVDSLDKPKGEVVVEVKVLEVNRDKLKEYGLKLSAESARMEYLPFQRSGNEETTTDGDKTTTKANGLMSLRAHFLSSLNLADFVATIPNGVFAAFLQTEETTRILAAPRLRAAEGKATTMQIGEDYPVPVASIAYGQGYTGATTQVQYRPVGVNLKLLPKVSPSGDIELELEVEFSLVGTPKPVGGQDYPSFLTRKVTGLVRVRDGQTSLLGGLLQSSEARSFSGIFGLQSVPLLNRVFSRTKAGDIEKEVLISLTPHIVRGPRLGPDDLKGLMIGTESDPRVAGARPPLFGLPDEEDEAAAVPSEAPTAPPAPASRPGSRPLPAVPQARPLPADTPVGTAPPAVRSSDPMAVPPQPESSLVPAPDPRALDRGELLQPAMPPGPSEPAPPVMEPSPDFSAPTALGVARETVASPPTAPASPAPTPAAPAPPLRAMLSPREVRVKTGETAIVGIVLTGARDLNSAEIVIGWTPGAVDVADVTTGALLTLDSSPVGSEKITQGNRLTVRFTRPTGTSGSGVVANVAVRGANPGPSELRLESLVVNGETSAMLPEAVRVEVLP